LKGHKTESDMAAQRIPVDQLRPGIFVQLELKWLAHPFFFSSFKIKSQDQIQTLKELNIREVLYFPEKSDCPPAVSPIAIKQDQTVPASSPTPAQDAMWENKRKQIQKLEKKRQQLQLCEKEYHRTIRQVSVVMQKLITGSKEAAAEADQLIQDIVDSLLMDQEAIVHLVNVKSKDEAVFFHTLNVAILAMVLGRQCGLKADETKSLGMGALFHDIGKNKVPKNLLYKRGTLTPPEARILQMHPHYGHQMMSQIEHFPEEALTIILEHHEAIDGSGYPKGIRKDEISFLSKITSVANNYDNLCNKLDPMESMTPYESLCHLFCRQKDQLDSELMTLFISCLGIYPPGTIVRLKNDMIGMVVSIDPKKPLRPSILVYDPDVPKAQALIIDLDEFPSFEIDRSLRPSQLPPEVYVYLDPRTRVSYFFDSTLDTQSPAPPG
jgi:putative nucleotidyltransferase with HDIG domain